MERDSWYCASRYLTIRDICRLMQVSRAYFYIGVNDVMWQRQKARICQICPAAELLFHYYSIDNVVAGAKKRNSDEQKKKRKTEKWLTPLYGIWYVFKRWIRHGLNAQGIRYLCNKKNYPILFPTYLMHVPRLIAGSVFNLNFPEQTLLTKTTLRADTLEVTIGTQLFDLHVRASTNSSAFFHKPKPGTNGFVYVYAKDIFVQSTVDDNQRDGKFNAFTRFLDYFFEKRQIIRAEDWWTADFLNYIGYNDNS